MEITWLRLHQFSVFKFRPHKSLNLEELGKKILLKLHIIFFFFCRFALSASEEREMM